MKINIKKLILPIILIIIFSGLIAGIYMLVYKPLLNDNYILEQEIKSKTNYLQQLRSIEDNKNQYEAELYEYKDLMDRYQLYFEEYGTFPKLIRMLTDVERRVGSEVVSIAKTENEIQLIINTPYKAFKDFLIELEGIEFFYNCNSIVVSRADETQFTLSDISQLTSQNYINEMTVEISASFSKELDFNLATIESEIQSLLKELGFIDAVVN